MNSPLIPVLFYKDTVFIVSHQEQPYVVMRPLVSNLGLNWKTQYEMIAKFSRTVSLSTTVGLDGKEREMVCMQLRKLPAWLGYTKNA